MDPGRGGCRGWGRGRGRGRGVAAGRIARKVTAREYATYFMHDRNLPTNSTFTYGKRLYQEWVVDQYSKVEGQRLQWVRLNQTTLRFDQYKGMVDAMQQDRANNPNFGRMVVLPATFAGSPCHMNQNYQDSMALVRKFGKPDLFITMTCNPNWPKILHELRPREEANDHLDLTSKVFNMKLNALLKDLLQNGVLGTTVADIHVVEWQKRGLPHGHILIILRSQDKPRDNNDYD